MVQRVRNCLTIAFCFTTCILPIFAESPAVKEARYEGVDAYLKELNELFRLAQVNRDAPGQTFETMPLDLSHDDKAWVLKKFVKATPRWLFFTRDGDNVTVTLRKLNLKLATFNVSRLVEENIITYKGHEIAMTDFFGAKTVRDRATALNAVVRQVKAINASEISMTQKFFEVVFKVATFPLQLLTACDSSGGGGDTAASGDGGPSGDPGAAGEDGNASTTACASCGQTAKCKTCGGSAEEQKKKNGHQTKAPPPKRQPQQEA